MVGSGQCISVLFVIPVIAYIGSQVFEIFTTVWDIHDGMDLLFGMQNMIEVEGEMSTCNGCYRFISRSNGQDDCPARRSLHSEVGSPIL